MCQKRKKKKFEEENPGKYPTKTSNHLSFMKIRPTRKKEKKEKKVEQRKSTLTQTRLNTNSLARCICKVTAHDTPTPPSSSQTLTP